MAGLVPFGMGFDSLDQFFRDPFPLSWNLPKAGFRMDIQENDQAFLLEAECPGVKKENVEISFNDGQLSISVKVDEETQSNDSGYIHRERRKSSMQRSIYLADVDPEGIEATLEEGILKVIVPKAAKMDNVKRIEIQ